jgi:hypothetical protein
MNRMLVLSALLLALAFSALAADPITPADVQAAQQAWGEAIVAIGLAHAQGGDARAEAQQALDTLYAYDLGPVLFKPTKAADQPFRPTPDAALSYFVGGSIPEDHGFALQPWSRVRFGDPDLFIDSDSAVAMGHYGFTDAQTGLETKVEYTFGYRRDADGRLRIFLHHSSLPYTPQH